MNINSLFDKYPNVTKEEMQKILDLEKDKFFEFNFKIRNEEIKQVYIIKEMKNINHINNNICLFITTEYKNNLKITYKNDFFNEKNFEYKDKNIEYGIDLLKKMKNNLNIIDLYFYLFKE
jgi:hypothetical protein